MQLLSFYLGQVQDKSGSREEQANGYYPGMRAVTARMGVMAIVARTWAHSSPLLPCSAIAYACYPLGGHKERDHI